MLLTVENRGVAPPYAPYAVRVKLSGRGRNLVRIVGTGCNSWMPGEPVASRYELSLPSDLEPGLYDVAIGVFDVTGGSDRPVELALQTSARDADGYYRVCGTKIVSASGG